MMRYYLEGWRRYAIFSGRACRREFWFFILFNCILGVIAQVADVCLGTRGEVGAIYGLIVLIPTWAVTFRRLHDVGRSGWNLLWLPIAFVGWSVVLYFICKEGTPGCNKYGFPPGR